MSGFDTRPAQLEANRIFYDWKRRTDTEGERVTMIGPVCLCGASLYEHDIGKVKAPRDAVAHGKPVHCDGFVLNGVEAMRCLGVFLPIPTS